MNASLVGLGVDPAQVRVPADGNDVDEDDTVLKRDKGEVDNLNERPQHPVSLESWPPSFLDSLISTLAFHSRHAAKEDTNHDGCKDKLIASNAGKDLESLVGNTDITGKETEPVGRNRSKYHYSLSIAVR